MQIKKTGPRSMPNNQYKYNKRFGVNKNEMLNDNLETIVKHSAHHFKISALMQIPNHPCRKS